MEAVSRRGRTSPLGQTLGAAIEEEIEADLHSKDRYKYGLLFGKSYVDSRPKEVIPPKSSAVDSKSRGKSKARSNNEDEIVRHMSNLPSFLQQAQKKDTIQDKALNFGVLDWKHLEKWKYNEHMPPVHHHSKKTLPPKGTSSSSSVPNLGKNPSLHSVDTVLLSSGKPISHDLRFGTPQSHSHVSHGMKESVDVGRGREGKFLKNLKIKEKEPWLEELEAARKQVNPEKMDLRDSYSYKRNVENHVARDPKKVVIPEIKASSSERNETKFSSFSHDYASSQGPSKESGLRNEVGSTSKYRTIGEQLGHFSLKDSLNRNRSYSEMTQFNDFRISSDGQFSGTSPSAYFAPDGLCSDIPYSCPLSSGTTAHAESLIEPPLKSASGKSRRHSFSVESSRAQDEASEQSNLKGSEPSPSRRFSFSFGRLNRSSSCKESSTTPQLSSGATGNKSGPLFPENSLNAGGIEGDKGNVSGRRRSSPLRRLLEPLTKHRRGKSTETVQTSNINSDIGKHMTLCNEGQSHDRKSEGPGTIQALLQVTLKDGLPFFKLVDDNSKDMLAAVIKKPPPTMSGKHDLHSVYVFYSVHEVKKKGFNWIGQGSKNKNSSLGYKILGQMKITNHCSPYPAENSSVARECILFGVDPLQGDKQNSEFSLGQEIAALVFKDSIRTISDEINNPYGMTVILPGGVHGIPVKGGHSSLISRWRSGGLCDCGGWDIGCKLRILTNDHRKTIGRTNNASSTSCSNVGRVNLYVQEKTNSKAKPVFSLEPLNSGLYSVKLDRSMSLLEAFATCVGLVTCREFAAMLDARDVPETESCRGDNGNRKAAEANYVSCPPLSPAGRI